MLSGRGLCDELITRPEESYRLWCVVVCDLETSRIGAPYTYDISSQRVKKQASKTSLGNLICVNIFQLNYEVELHFKTFVLIHHGG